MIEWSLGIHKNEASAGSVAFWHRQPRGLGWHEEHPGASRGWLWGQLRCHLRGTAQVSQPRNAGNEPAPFVRACPWLPGWMEPAPPSPEKLMKSMCQLLHSFCQTPGGQHEDSQ